MLVHDKLTYPYFIHINSKQYLIHSSLYDGALGMKQFFALNFYSLAYWLGKSEESCRHQEGHALISSQHSAKEVLIESIGQVSKGCELLELRVSRRKADRLKNDIEKQSCAFGNIYQGLGELHERIFDELGSSWMFCLSAEKERYYVEPWLTFGQRIVEVFPALSHDIEEAGKCYGAQRNTGCVFHLMRIMEVGLCALASKVGVSPTIPSWDGILNKIDTEIKKKYGDKSRDWIDQESIISEAVSHLRTVKTAWRNPTMHVESKYTDEEALEIYNAVRVFMKHLATKL